MGTFCEVHAGANFARDSIAPCADAINKILASLLRKKKRRFQPGLSVSFLLATEHRKNPKHQKKKKQKNKKNSFSQCDVCLLYAF
jgi:hypothetical protein